MKLINYNKNNVLHVDLNGPPAKRWSEVVEQTGDQIHEILADVVELCEEDFPDVPPWIQPLYKSAVHGAVKLGGRLVGIVARLFGQEYQAEIKGMAKQAGGSDPPLLRVNLT